MQVVEFVFDLDRKLVAFVSFISSMAAYVNTTRMSNTPDRVNLNTKSFKQVECRFDVFFSLLRMTFQNIQKIQMAFVFLLACQRDPCVALMQGPDTNCPKKAHWDIPSIQVGQYVPAFTKLTMKNRIRVHDTRRRKKSSQKNIRHWVKRL